MKRLLAVLICLSFSVLGFGCSSGPEVKKQGYAQLRDNRVYEYEFPIVWKGIESTFRNYSVVDRDPAEVDAVELKRLTKRTLETDWIQTQSRDKYVEFVVNDVPQKRYLWTRVKYKVIAESALGGTRVTVRTQEEVERLKNNGTSDGYEKVTEVDSSRPSEILEKVQMAILSAAP
jgi:hypothetical protein